MWSATLHRVCRSLPSKMVRQLTSCHIATAILALIHSSPARPYHAVMGQSIRSWTRDARWSNGVRSPGMRFRLSGLKVVGDSRSQLTRAFQSAYGRFCRHEAQPKKRARDTTEPPKRIRKMSNEGYHKRLSRPRVSGKWQGDHDGIGLNACHPPSRAPDRRLHV